MEQFIGDEQVVNPLETTQPKWLRIAAHVISAVFHPILIPVYITYFLLFIHPLVFDGFPDLGKMQILATVFINYALLPAFTVFLAWRLKFAKSVFLRTQKERLIPYALTMIFAFWCWHVFNNLDYSPPIFVTFLLGSFIAVIIGWFANIYFKISMHGLAIGGMLFFLISLSLTGEGSGGIYIAVALLIAGLVCTARFIVSDHNPFEIYAGLFAGIAAQWIASVL
jgi:hypothetical protein